MACFDIKSREIIFVDMSMNANNLFLDKKFRCSVFFLKSMTGEQHTHIDHTQPVFHNKRVQRLGEAVRIARSYVRQTNRVCDEGTQRRKPDHHEYQFGGGFGPR